MAAGVLNEFARASVVLLSATGAPVRPRSENPLYQCDGASELTTGHVFLLPRIETNVAQAYEQVSSIQMQGTELKVTFEDGIVHLRQDLETEFAVTDGFSVRHQALEAQGKLDHSLDRCPFVTGTHEIREWSPLLGWSTKTVVLAPFQPTGTR